jgi:hypothetical protein
VVEHRRAVVHLGTQRIARLLALPEGLRVLAARDDFIRDGVAVLVEGDALELQPEACVLPDLPLAALDRTELAMRAAVTATWRDDDTAEGLTVHCPDDGCAWSRNLEHWAPALALIADVVQQHLTEQHA